MKETVLLELCMTLYNSEVKRHLICFILGTMTSREVQIPSQRLYLYIQMHFFFSWICKVMTALSNSIGALETRKN